LQVASLIWTRFDRFWHFLFEDVQDATEERIFVGIAVETAVLDHGKDVEGNESFEEFKVKLLFYLFGRYFLLTRVNS
jgi:hypothetical protein